MSAITQFATSFEETRHYLKIVPVLENMRMSDSLVKHTQSIADIIHNALSERGLLECADALTFFNILEKSLPIVNPSISETSPGAVSITLLCHCIPTYDLAQFFSEMIIRWLIPGTHATILNTKSLTFRFRDNPKDTYFVSEILAYIQDAEHQHIVKKNLPSLTQEIALGAVSQHHARHILVTKALTQEQKTTLIHKTIVQLSNRKFHTIAPDVFFEMHHFLLACDDEFKRIRDVRHMCKIICYHNWFRRLLRSHRKELTQTTPRKIYYKVLSTKLSFQFGHKNVVGIIIAINHLEEYEQFEAKHIVSCIQQFIPDAQAVPHSFFSYQNPTDSIYSFYVEISRKDGSEITLDELKLLKSGLGHQLPLSIEKLSHKLFMPQNEEEVLRNILLLSQQIRYVKDIPQIIISFQGQTETSLTFHVTLVRVLKDGAMQPVEALFKAAHNSVLFRPGVRKLVGTVRNKYPKEANTFFLDCEKQEFMRQDHSVDLSRAREYVAQEIKKAVGDVRDFNGGLIYQQNKQLAQVKELLSSQEKKYEMYLENLFHSIHPTLMRSFLSPEQIKELFGLFLVLKKDRASHQTQPWKVHIKGTTLYLISLVLTENFVQDLISIAKEAGLQDSEIATTSLTIHNQQYAGCVLTARDDIPLQTLKQSFEHKLTQIKTAKNSPKSLKISLPRPTSLLDPRVGTDRTSGIVIKMLYEGLMRVDPTGKPTPATAKNVRISQDQKHYCFTLRDTKWTNGKPVTAYDFEYAWKKALDPTFKTLFAYLFYPIKNAREAKNGEKPLDDVGIIAKDAKTLEVYLEHPAPYFLELTAHWIYSPLCKEIDMLHPGWAYYGDDTYVCNGPFKLGKWKRNSEIQALKNNDYWDKEQVKLEHIDISVIEDSKQALSLYLKGELDWIGEPLSEIPPDIFKQKNFSGHIYSHPISAVHWYVCNVNVPPLTSIKCRTALAIALNRQTIINELLEGFEQPAYSVVPSSLALQKGAYFSDGNIEQARVLFREGLEEQGLSHNNLSPFTVLCLDQDLYRSVALECARQWRDVLGIEVQIMFHKWEQFLEHYSQQNFQMVGITWYSWYNDPIYNLNTLKSKSYEMNPTEWDNSVYLELLDRAKESINIAQRNELMREAEQIAMKEMPVIPLFYYTFKYMKKEHVKGIFLSHLGQIDFKWASISAQE